MTLPELGWTTDGHVTDVHDGDTITVRVYRDFRVRLRDCWAPEKRIDPRLSPIDQNAAKLRGVAAMAHLQQIAERKQCTLQIPTHPTDDATQDIGESFSMGRAVGRVWIDEGDLSEIQVQHGYATRAKGGGT